MDKLYDRYYTNIGGVTFIALYMQQQDVSRSVLAVFAIIGHSYQFQMEMSNEMWNDITGYSALSRLASKLTPPSTPA